MNDIFKIIINRIRKYFFPPQEFYKKSWMYYISWIFQMSLLILVLILIFQHYAFPRTYYFIETCNGNPTFSSCLIDEIRQFYPDYERVCGNNSFISEINETFIYFNYSEVTG